MKFYKWKFYWINFYLHFRKRIKNQKYTRWDTSIITRGTEGVDFECRKCSNWSVPDSKKKLRFKTDSFRIGILRIFIGEMKIKITNFSDHLSGLLARLQAQNSQEIEFYKWHHGKYIQRNHKQKLFFDKNPNISQLY